jgi:hypothetical protein
MVEGVKIDVEGLTHSRVTLQYPYIKLNNINDTTPLVLSTLENGPMKIIGEYKGQCKVLGSMSGSAYNIDKLLRTHDSLDYVVSDGNVNCITTVREYLEVLSGWTH